MYDFLQSFADFVQACQVDYEKQHLLNSTEYQRARETAHKLREIITGECMVPGTERLLELYDETENWANAMGTQSAFMAGFKLALELQLLANNPQPLISAPWNREKHEEYWKEVEQQTKEILEKVNARRIGKDSI